MLSKPMMEDLKSFGVPILTLGDSFQLPSIDGDSYFHENYPVDFFLTEIHRQSLENPIIWLSKHVREGNDIDFGTYGDGVMKIRHSDATEEMWLGASQLICGTNKTRRACNTWFRDALGHSDINSIFPVKGEKIMCLKNRWAAGLVNGMVLDVTENAKVASDREQFKLTFNVKDGDKIIPFKNIGCSAHEILGKKSGLPWWEQKKLLPVDYAYAATTHKMQGSQCDKVVFIDEGFGRWLKDNTYYRHLYTSITRAVSGLIILQ
jgi:exodeoxyribonuclease-5